MEVLPAVEEIHSHARDGHGRRRDRQAGPGGAVHARAGERRVRAQPVRAGVRRPRRGQRRQRAVPKRRSRDAWRSTRPTPATSSRSGSRTAGPTARARQPGGTTRSTQEDHPQGHSAPLLALRRRAVARRREVTTSARRTRGYRRSRPSRRPTPSRSGSTPPPRATRSSPPTRYRRRLGGAPARDRGFANPRPSATTLQRQGDADRGSVRRAARRTRHLASASSHPARRAAQERGLRQRRHLSARRRGLRPVDQRRRVSEPARSIYGEHGSLHADDRQPGGGTAGTAR